MTRGAASDRRPPARWPLLALVGVVVAFGVAASAVAWFISLAAVAAWGLSRLHQAAMARHMEVHRNISASVIELGESVDVEVTVANAEGAMVPWVEVREGGTVGPEVWGTTSALTPIRRGGEIGLRYILKPDRRGFYGVGPIQVATEDLLGTHRSEYVDTNMGFVTCLPAEIELPFASGSGRPAHERPDRRSFFEDPTRFAGVRAYEPGDPLKKIHWRATARTGELRTKVFEETGLGGVLLAVDAFGPTYRALRRRIYALQTRKDVQAAIDEERGLDRLLERAIVVAASLSRHVLAGGQRVALFSNGWDAADAYPSWEGGTFTRTRLDDGERPGPPVVQVPVGRGSEQRRTVRTALARLTATDELSLARALDRYAGTLPRDLGVVVVTPRVDAELDAALLGLRRQGFDVRVVIVGHDALLDGATESAEAEVALHGVHDEASLQALGAVTL